MRDLNLFALTDQHGAAEQGCDDHESQDDEEDILLDDATEQPTEEEIDGPQED